MLNARFVPVEKWPVKKTESYQQKKSPFDAGYGQTLDLLEKELRFLGAKEILIQAYFDHSNIRNDGWPKSSSRPKQSGVILTFEGKNKKTVSLPCDKFRDWESNLRAIALSLEALRKVDRYGVTQNGEQYRGWESLPAPGAQVVFDREWYTQIIVKHSGIHVASIATSKEALELAYKNALLRTHPDKGGNSEDFLMVQEAYKFLSRAA